MKTLSWLRAKKKRLQEIKVGLKTCVQKQRYRLGLYLDTRKMASFRSLDHRLSLYHPLLKKIWKRIEVHLLYGGLDIRDVFSAEIERSRLEKFGAAPNTPRWYWMDYQEGWEEDPEGLVQDALRGDYDADKSLEGFSFDSLDFLKGRGLHFMEVRHLAKKYAQQVAEKFRQKREAEKEEEFASDLSEKLGSLGPKEIAAVLGWQLEDVLAVLERRSGEKDESE